MAKRNRDRRREARKQRKEDKVAMRNADNLVEANKERDKRKKKEEPKKKDIVDKATGLTIPPAEEENIVQSSKAPKKKKVTTVKAPVSTINPNISIPQSQVTTVDGKVVPEKKQKKQKVGIDPITGIDAVDNRSNVQLGDAIKDEAAKKVDLGESTLKEYEASFDDSEAVEQVKEKEKEDAEKRASIPGDGSTLSGAVSDGADISGGAPPASFSQVGTRQQAEQAVKDQNKRDAVESGNTAALNNLAEQAAVEKLGVQDYYPQAARNVGVGTFTGEIIGSQTIYSGAGVLAPMGLYDARKRALVKAAQAKQKAINDFLTLKDTAKAYNMEYKDQAYDALYGILKDHNFSVSSVMRDQKAMKEVQRWKGLGKELLFIEKEAKAVMTNISKEDKYVPDKFKKLAKDLYYGLQDKDKVFSGDVKLTPKIAEMKTYLSLIKKSEDLAKEYKATLSQRPMTQQEIESGEIKGDEKFEKGKADFMKRVNKGELDRDQDGYITGVLKYFGGNVDDLFKSYISSGEYSDDQLKDAKKIFVNLMPQSVELSIENYQKAMTSKDLANLALKKRRLDIMDKTQVGFYDMTTSNMMKASDGISNVTGMDLSIMGTYDRNLFIQKKYSSVGNVKTGNEIPGYMASDDGFAMNPKDPIFASISISTEKPLLITDQSQPKTTVTITNSKGSKVRKVLTPIEILGEWNANKGSKGFKIEADNGELWTETDFSNLRTYIAGGKATAATNQLVPTQVNNYLGFYDFGTMKQLNASNLDDYIESENKSAMRNYTGQLQVVKYNKERLKTVGISSSEAFKQGVSEKYIEQTVSLPGSFTSNNQVANNATNAADNELLIGAPEKKNMQREVFSTLSRETD